MKIRRTFPVKYLGQKLTCEIEITLESRNHYSWVIFALETEAKDFILGELPDSLQTDIEMTAEDMAKEEAHFVFQTDAEREDELAERRLNIQREEE